MNAENLMTQITNFLSNPNFIQLLASIFLISVACFLLCGIFRLIFGPKNILVLSISSILGILILYCVRMLADPYLSSFRFISELPFTVIHADMTCLSAVRTMEKSMFYAELLRLIILVFLFGLFEDLLPEGKRLLPWILLRTIGITITFAVFTALEYLLTVLFPNFLSEFAPFVLVALLGLFLAVTLFKWLLGVILGVVTGPVVGGIYTFFVSHIIGKQLTKSALTASLLLLLIDLAHHFDKTSITTDASVFSILIPIILFLAILRYLFKRIF